jgi:hypothetical protein
MQETFQMTMKEADRYNVIKQVISKKLKQTEAARQLKLSLRQIRRLVKKVKSNGVRGVIHGLRGRKSNNQLSLQLHQRIKEIIYDPIYKGFGPTLLSEKLEEREEIQISVSALRRIMIDEELWQAKKPKPRHRKNRVRRSRIGELIQIDASPHAWFEDRGEECNLIHFIDDATSDIFLSRFVKSEDRQTLMELTKEFVKENGRPGGVYTDKHSIYKVNRQPTIEEELKDKQPKTQYARAMEELNIELICANSPQAKGRVERAFGVDQDRLVKEMRLEGISNMEEGNKFLKEYYIPKRNKKFGVKPLNPTKAFRPLLPEHNLTSIFSCRTNRTIKNDYTIQYKNKWFQITKDQKKRVFSKNKVEVEERLDGSIHLLYKGIYLKYKEITKRPKKQIKSTVVAGRKKINEMKLFNQALNRAWVDEPIQDCKEGECKETAAEYIQPYRAVDILQKSGQSYAQF